MPITIFDSDTIPRDRRPDIEAAVVAARQASQKALRGLDSRNTRPPKVRRADHVIPRVRYFSAVRMERDCGRGYRAGAGGDRRLTLVGFAAADCVDASADSGTGAVREHHTASMAALCFPAGGPHWPTPSVKPWNEMRRVPRSEEHTSELQSPCNLV